jgi:hypothetical protein
MRSGEFIGMIRLSTIGFSSPETTVIKGRISLLILTKSGEE